MDDGLAQGEQARRDPELPELRNPNDNLQPLEFDREHEIHSQIFDRSEENRQQHHQAMMMLDSLSASLPPKRYWTRLPSFQVNAERHETPPARRGHTCTTLSHSQMLLFGGVGRSPDGNRLLNDTYLYIFGTFRIDYFMYFIYLFIYLI
jgi:hypothetical protein